MKASKARSRKKGSQTGRTVKPRGKKLTARSKKPVRATKQRRKHASKKANSHGLIQQLSTPEKQKLFLEQFIECGNIYDAAVAAGIDRGTHYNWLKADPDYSKAFEEAKEAAADVLEGELRRRALRGVDEPVYYRGRKITTVKRYSDTLGMFLLKKLRPEFREHQRLDLGSADGQPLRIEVTSALDMIYGAGSSADTAESDSAPPS